MGENKGWNRRERKGEDPGHYTPLTPKALPMIDENDNCERRTEPGRTLNYSLFRYGHPHKTSGDLPSRPNRRGRTESLTFLHLSDTKSRRDTHRVAETVLLDHPSHEGPVAPVDEDRLYTPITVPRYTLGPFVSRVNYTTSNSSVDGHLGRYGPGHPDVSLYVMGKE